MFSLLVLNVLSGFKLPRKEEILTKTVKLIEMKYFWYKNTKYGV
jgi:hypothetical protein